METEINKNFLERYKLLAEQLLHTNKPIFVKTINGNLYFGDILFVGEDTIEINCFGPPQRAGEKFILYWANIARLDEYKNKEELIA